MFSPAAATQSLRRYDIGNILDRGFFQFLHPVDALIALRSPHYVGHRENFVAEPHDAFSFAWSCSWSLALLGLGDPSLF